MATESGVNAQLHTLYSNFWQHVVPEIPPLEGLSNPLFLYATDSYLAARRKLLIIGQQTNGWAVNSHGLGESLGDDPATRLMEHYLGFQFGKSLGGSPFWRAAHELRQGLRPQSASDALAWSNLVRVDRAGRRPPPLVEELTSRAGLLAAELRILEPTAVVFFTGPYYDHRLTTTLPGLRIEQTEIRGLARLEHDLLPQTSFRTYHPGYLLPARLWHTLEAIRDLCDLS